MIDHITLPLLTPITDSIRNMVPFAQIPALSRLCHLQERLHEQIAPIPSQILAIAVENQLLPVGTDAIIDDFDAVVHGRGIASVLAADIPHFVDDVVGVHGAVVDHVGAHHEGCLVRPGLVLALECCGRVLGQVRGGEVKDGGFILDNGRFVAGREADAGTEEGVLVNFTVEGRGAAVKVFLGDEVLGTVAGDNSFALAGVC